MARKSRKNLPDTIALPSNVSRTAIYARLSIEDDDNDSLENQISLVKAYIDDDESLHYIGSYADNGKTGTNFDRPQFVKLMDDIKAGVINCIAVKDLSRFGRTYIETCDYIEKILPFMGVRFISVNDRFDSADDDSNAMLIIYLKNLVNDYYAKDISRKLVTAFDVKRKNGEYRTTAPPYGYLKSPEDKHKLIIDEDVAPIVREIFECRANGDGITKIALMLNQRNVPSPSKHLFNKGLLSPRKNISLQWVPSTISVMTSNPIYIGRLETGKIRQALCENMPSTKMPSDQWVVTVNAHAPIIDMDTWERTQKIVTERAEKHKNNRNKYSHIGTENIFRGLLVCGDCGRQLQRKKVTRKDQASYYFTCVDRVLKLNMSCVYKVVKEAELMKSVLKSVQKWIDVAIEAENIITTLVLTTENKAAIALTNSKIREAENRLSKLGDLQGNLYMEFAEKLMTEDEYIYAKNQFAAEVEALNTRLEGLYQTKTTQTETLSPRNKWITAMKNFKDEKTVTAEMISSLIEKIVVHGRNRLEIIWNHRDDYRTLLDYFIESEVNVKQRLGVK